MKLNIIVLVIWLLLITAIQVTPASIQRYPDNCLATPSYIPDLTTIPKSSLGKINKQIPVKTGLKYKTKGK